MNEPTPEHDELLRRALQAEAEGIEASDALLDRTLAAARRPAVRPSRRLLVAAAVAAVAVGVGVALTRGDDEPLETIDDPTTTTVDEAPEPDDGEVLNALFPCRAGDVVRLSVFVERGSGSDDVFGALESDDRVLELSASSTDDTATMFGVLGGESPPVEEVPSAFSATFASSEDELAVRSTIADLPGVSTLSTTDCTGAPIDPGGDARPDLIALVREDGWLVVVDLATGEERELHFGGDPDAPPTGLEEGGPQFIDGVDLSPDGGWIFFSTCCEPASGTTFRIPIDGGEPEQVAVGAYPRVSPDGRFVATGAGDLVIVTPVDGGEVAASPQLECCFSRLAWSPDGTRLAAITGVGEADEVRQALLFDWDGSNLTVSDTGKPDNPGSFVSWTPDGRLTISSGGPVDDDRDLSQDASYGWLLWVDEAGVVREQAGFESSERSPIDGLPEALVADW
jgi:hypothetical protein